MFIVFLKKEMIPKFEVPLYDLLFFIKYGT